MKFFPPLILFVAACSGEKDDDVDGDGIRSPLDCNDNDAAVHPGVSELCDGVDNDCNGMVDDGVSNRYWPDADGDGAGDMTAVPVEACDLPTGYVEGNTDCDDTQPTVNPGAPELCDEIDQNCDGDPYEGATDLRTWYRDTDGDLFGSDVTLLQCAEPTEGYVAQTGDCNDDRATIYPGAPETCNGLDDDCDTVIDNDPIDPTVLYQDSDLDGYGDPSVSQTSCPLEGWVDNAGDCDDTTAEIEDGIDYYVDADLDGYGDELQPMIPGCEPGPGLSLEPGDCDDSQGTVYPGAPELCDGADQDCDLVIDEEPSDGIVYHPDADLDGYGDITIAIPSCEPVPGAVIDGTDCNDQAASAHPGALELCDGGIDNDCDASTTDDDSADALTWYLDDDGDNHGVPTGSALACLQPVGYAPVDDDCDDASADTHPGHNELCDGGIDNDCDPTTDEAFTAEWYLDSDDDGYGNDQFVVNGCTPPAGYVQEGGDCDDTDATLNPGLTPNCIQDHCGTITLSQTWKNTVEHTVSCDVIVEGAAKPRLTIQDGVIVRFAGGTELRVGKSSEGDLRVLGGAQGVIFTSAAAVPQPGDWDGLLLGAKDRGSIITSLLVEYGGKNGKGGVVVEGGNPTFNDLVSQWNLGDGLHVTGSEPRVYNSALVYNTDNGLYVGVGAGLSRTTSTGGSGPSFENNVVTDNAGLPITIPGSHADEIALSNTLAPNDVDEIELLTGTLRFTGTWYDHGLPYRVADNAQIDVEDGPQADLFVEDGVEIYFGVSAGLSIGDGAAGTLTLEDGPQGIVFSATPAVISSSSNWDGVTFGADDAGSLVQNLLVEYGGGNGKGNLYINDSAPLVSDILSRYSDSAGIYVTGTTAAPEIRDSVIVDNDQDGVYVTNTSGIARSLIGPTFAGNLLTGNGQSSVVLPPNFVGELDPSTQFSGNGRRIYIHGGTVLEDALWRKLDEDYEVLSDVKVQGPQDPVLELEDTITLYFQRDAALEAGVSDDGALIIDADVGVNMQSADVAPGPGDWEGIEIGRNGLLRSQTSLRGLFIRHAGGSDVQDGGAIEVLDRDACTSQEPRVTLSEIAIRDSSKAGLYAESWTTFSADHLVISGALDGCVHLVVPSSCPPVDVVSYTYNDCQDGAIFGEWTIAEADKLDSTSTYPGPVLIPDTVLTQDVTVPVLPVPYRVTALLQVKDDAMPTLTLSPGVIMEFDTNAGLEIGAGNEGGLVADGVTFTSSKSSPAQGDWEGIRLGQYCTEVELTNSVVEYGGANNHANVWVDDCDVGTVSDSSLTDSNTCGIAVDGLLTYENLTFSNNAGGDVCL
jgi:hypothetical protein